LVAINPGDSVLTVCENGYGKRTSIDAYRKIRRGGKGVINIKTTERNGKVVAILAVADDDELMMITANSMMLRTDLSAVREIGRATQGVRLIRLVEGDRVVAVEKIASENPEGETTDAGTDAAQNSKSVETRIAGESPPAGDDAPGPPQGPTPDTEG
jgi:DNA gyrase subunit A